MFSRFSGYSIKGLVVLFYLLSSLFLKEWKADFIFVILSVLSALVVIFSYFLAASSQGVNNVTFFINYVRQIEWKCSTFVKWYYFHYKYKTIMNTTELKGTWEEQKGKLKQKFAALTDNDLMFSEGKKEEMLGRIQIKLGKTKEELHKIISSL